jgi:hypothetical protein
MLAVLLIAPVGLLPPAQAGLAIGPGSAPAARSAAVVQAAGDREWQAGALKRPYAKLFAPQAPDAPPQARAASSEATAEVTAPAPRRSNTVIICGMTVFQVDIPYPPPKSMGILKPQFYSDRGAVIGSIRLARSAGSALDAPLDPLADRTRAGMFP